MPLGYWRFYFTRDLKAIVYLFMFIHSSLIQYRMARMEAAVFVGLLLGSLSSAPIYQATSAAFVFACAAFSTLIGLSYLYFCVGESLKNACTEASRMVSN